jgi:hypothetical protein
MIETVRIEASCFQHLLLTPGVAASAHRYNQRTLFRQEASALSTQHTRKRQVYRHFPKQRQ